MLSVDSISPRALGEALIPALSAHSSAGGGRSRPSSLSGHVPTPPTPVAIAGLVQCWGLHGLEVGGHQLVPPRPRSHPVATTICSHSMQEGRQGHQPHGAPGDAWQGHGVSVQHCLQHPPKLPPSPSCQAPSPFCPAPASFLLAHMKPGQPKGPAAAGAQPG